MGEPTEESGGEFGEDSELSEEPTQDSYEEFDDDELSDEPTDDSDDDELSEYQQRIWHLLRGSLTKWMQLNQIRNSQKILQLLVKKQRSWMPMRNRQRK